MSATADRRLEQLAQQIVVAEAAMVVGISFGREVCAVWMAGFWCTAVEWRSPFLGWILVKIQRCRTRQSAAASRF